MEFTKLKGNKSTIRDIWSDDKKTLLGSVGTVEDFLKARVLTYTDYPAETWVFIPVPGIALVRFGATKEDVLVGLDKF